MERLIGSYEGDQKGPLLIVFSAMHGNEPAGVKALEMVFKMLEVEPITNPNFTFTGKIVGMIGNLQAYKKGIRFLKKDLNRQFIPSNIERVQASAASELDTEDLELKQLMESVDNEITNYKPSRLVFLDLHTTTAFGGIFTIPGRDAESERIGVELHAPVIKGFLEGIQGTTLHYFKAENFTLPVAAVTFESGQHNEKLSVNRAIAAIINCMRSIDCVSASHVENQHDSLLIEFSKALPKLAELSVVHPVSDSDQFEMLEGFKNFQKIEKGQLLAKDINGEIRAPKSGLLLMPLYQKQGEDGFFIIEMLEAF